MKRFKNFLLLLGLAGVSLGTFSCEEDEERQLVDQHSIKANAGAAKTIEQLANDPNLAEFVRLQTNIYDTYDRKLLAMTVEQQTADLRLLDSLAKTEVVNSEVAAEYLGYVDEHTFMQVFEQLGITGKYLLDKYPVLKSMEEPEKRQVLFEAAEIVYQRNSSLFLFQERNVNTARIAGWCADKYDNCLDVARFQYIVMGLGCTGLLSTGIGAPGAVACVIADIGYAKASAKSCLLDFQRCND